MNYMGNVGSLCSKCCTCIHLFNLTKPHAVGTIITTILQMKTLRHKED